MADRRICGEKDRDGGEKVMTIGRREQRVQYGWLLCLEHPTAEDGRGTRVTCSSVNCRFIINTGLVRGVYKAL
jgi:hypothetical protein